MSDVLHAGDTLFEAFVEQVKQVLEHLYDFAYLQQHPLARAYDGEGDLSAKTAGRQLRYELIKAIESFKPTQDTHFRAPDARLYNILHFYYLENLTIQEAGAELGLSERQAYRDLRRGQESVAAVLWDKRLPPADQADSPKQDFSLESEVARLKLKFSPVDVGTVVQNAQHAVERLAQQQSVEIVVEPSVEPLMLSTDAALAHQVIVSVLSHAIQQAQAGDLSISLASEQDGLALALDYRVRADAGTEMITDSVVSKLAERLQWRLVSADTSGDQRQIVLHMASRRTTILAIDDNEGWIELLDRFLEGYNCLVVSTSGGAETLQRAQELNPSAIILDVMMPEKDGWELLQRLRAQPATSHIPIIVCTVFNDSQLAYSLGASAFVAKPASREKILETLKVLSIL